MNVKIVFIFKRSITMTTPGLRHKLFSAFCILHSAECRMQLQKNATTAAAEKTITLIGTKKPGTTSEKAENHKNKTLDR
jgi:hypothetical protein